MSSVYGYLFFVFFYFSWALKVFYVVLLIQTRAFNLTMHTQYYDI